MNRNRIKIAIDANEAFRPKLTGIGIYVRHLVKQLSSLQTQQEIIFLGFHSSKVNLNITGSHKIKLLRSAGYRTFWSQIRLPLHFMAHRYGLFHYLEHKLPPVTFCKTVITIYDLGFIKYPETAHALHRKRFLFFTKDAVQRANRIIAISHSTKKDICEFFGTSSEKIEVVHLGVDHTLYNPKASPLKRKNPYLLSVGTLQPRKNYVMLFRAFRKLCEKTNGICELLIVGKRGWFWEDIEKEAANGSFSERIHFLGYVPDEQMPSLYAGCEFFVMPSLYEGFGIPLLEAMACGKAVIASNASSLPEIVDDAGILLDPKDECAWTEAMLELLKDKSERNELGKSAFSKAACFSWEKMASETLEVYQKVLAE
ncbi:MAG: glycosyltransferase family 4 protein [Bacteroidetes bacterium]|nr:glycosyltransferase family 4 protein [Bacteroidota bacterium]